jgi:signal transduction histidine kinase
MTRADPAWAEGTDPEPRLAAGTREMDRVPAETIAPHRRASSEVVQIVHDLKNPLATIALEMSLLEDKLVQAELKGAVTRVAQNVAFLDRMVHDLLDASALDAESFEIQRKPTELRSLLEHVVERATASRDRSRVFLETPASVTLMIDDLRIERVVANLLQNALKYSPSTSGVLIRLDVSPDVAKVSVIDAGRGITAEEKTFIFDKYRRAAVARALEGNGLGLYVSKKIVEAHGGRIGVDSVHGAGSCFYFELPLNA